MPQLTRSTRAVLHSDLAGVPASGVQTFDALYRVAQACYKSGLFEDVTDEAQAFVKILKGQEMGLPPTTAMSAFDLIRKRLFIKPWAIAAMINACGYGMYRIIEQTAEQCVIHFHRKYPGQGWAVCPPVSYTFAEAKAQGLVERSVHWKANPAHMLYQRCMGRGGAMYFPELLAGLTPPQDDAPIPPERHQQNIIDLFGEGAVDARTGELVAQPIAGSASPASQDRPQSTIAPHDDIPDVGDDGTASWVDPGRNLMDEEAQAERDAMREEGA